MIRDPAALAERTFDVTVVGAGIQGAAIARELACAGYATALIDQGDFCGATSANSLKIIHGGLRYLQDANIARMRESIRARSAMLRIAPHIARPLPCLIPTRGWKTRGRHALRAALWLNALMSCDRNRGLGPADRLPAGAIVSREECLRLVPGLEPAGVTGGAIWWDALALNTERLALEFVADAVEHGACAANYARATSLIEGRGGGRVRGVRVEDLLGGGAFDVRSGAVIDATGPWLGRLLGERSGAHAGGEPWAKAMNVVVARPLFRECAVGLEGIFGEDAGRPWKRFYFFVPWRGRTIIGTSYTPWRGDPGTVRPTAADVQSLIREINTAYPAGALEVGDVSFVHLGILPVGEGSDHPDFARHLDSRTRIIDRGASGGPAGVYSVRAVKYTTAPETARKVVEVLGRAGIRPSGSGAARLDGAAVARREATAAGSYPEDIAAHLRRTYGSRFEAVARHCAGRMSWVSDDPPLLEGEIVHFIREEMAVTLADIVFRRSGLGTAGRPPEDVLGRVARIAGQELGWDAERAAREIREVEERYSTCHGPKT